jgi:hypothetical protein
MGNEPARGITGAMKPGMLDRPFGKKFYRAVLIVYFRVINHH